MLDHAKELKAALKKVGCIKTSNSDPSLAIKLSIRVRTERRYAGKNSRGKALYERGPAYGFTDPLSEEQINALKNLLPYCRIKNYPADHLAIIYSH